MVVGDDNDAGTKFKKKVSFENKLILHTTNFQYHSFKLNLIYQPMTTTTNPLPCTPKPKTEEQEWPNLISKRARRKKQISDTGPK